MNTATRYYPGRRFSLPTKAESTEVAIRPRKRNYEDPGLLFVVGSVALHIGLLIGFSSMPEAAHAASAKPHDIEVSLIELAPEPASPPLAQSEALPLGSLEAPMVEEMARPSPKVRDTRNSAAEKEVSKREVNPSETIATEALPLLTASNPYGAANAAVFTSGNGNTGGDSAASVTTVVHNPGPSFGIESGSAHFSQERAQALNAWHKKVRAQLSHLASRAYPRRAQKLGHEGTAKVTVLIGEDGNILSASVTNSSSHASLDRAALATLGSVGKVAAPPRGTGTSRLTIPMSFRLR